jgi:Holliday junction resolvase RusA-like endonuclease
MIRELLPHKVVIPGDAPSRANLNLNYKLKGVPAHKIRNKSQASAKRRFDHIMACKDAVSIIIRNEANKAKIRPARELEKIFVALVLYFKAKDPDETKLRKDGDNAQKWILDSLTQSLLIPDDKNIVCTILLKRVDFKNPRIEILRLSASDNLDDIPAWVTETAKLIPKSISESTPLAEHSTKSL